MPKNYRAQGHRLRKGRYSIPGQIYLATMVVHNRTAVFADLKPARCAIRCLYANDVAEHACTLSFVVMPDHVHWLFQLYETGDLSKVVRLYKAKVSHALGCHIWQRGFYDRALRVHEDVVSISRYIVANPLRAGLVEHIGDYPHWDAVWLTGV